MSEPLDVAKERRLLYSSEGRSFRMLSLAQNADGSIYVSAPDFGGIRWMIPAVMPGQASLELLQYQMNQPGKLSLHGSGISHLRPFEGTADNDFRIAGSALKDPSTGAASVRHLVTIMLGKPTHVPESPRASDVAFFAPSFFPVVVVLWAVPTGTPGVKVKFTFEFDDVAGVFHQQGFGAFQLRTHVVFAWAYRTRHMATWPTIPHAVYLDGHTVPMFLPKAGGMVSLELRKPHYNVDAEGLSIDLAIPEAPE